MTRQPSAYAVDYIPKLIEENDVRFPPTHHQPRLPPEESFESMTAKYGRPFGPFEKGREHPYRASTSSAAYDGSHD